MKKEYMIPEMEITHFGSEDVITGDSTEPIFPYSSKGNWLIIE